MKVRDRLRDLDRRVLGGSRKPTLRSNLVTNLVVAVVFAAIGVVVVLTGHRPEGWGVVGVAVLGFLIWCVGDVIRRG